MDVTRARNVNELSPDEKRSLEMLIGSPLEPDQNVLILTYTPGVLPEDSVRQAARERILKTLQANQKIAIEEGVSPADADDAVGDAMSRVRHRP